MKWLATTKRRWVLYLNSPASGLRLLFHAAFVGATRPGLNESSGPLPPLTTVVAVVEPPPGRSTNSRPRSVRNRKIWRSEERRVGKGGEARWGGRAKRIDDTS